MPRYVALLRGINVGGHRIKMDILRGFFEELEYTEVDTFITSGNVIFSSTTRSSSKLERRIEQHLQERLGYEVATFVRTLDELKAVTLFEASDEVEKGSGDSAYVVFLPGAADAAMRDRFTGLQSATDRFQFGRRKVYWFVRGKLTESPLFVTGITKATGSVPNTMRNITTVRKLVVKYGDGG